MKSYIRFTLTFVLIFFIEVLIGGDLPWVPDIGNGYYKNPIIYADYSDPDVIKVGDDFFMTASSFNCVPALPILHSKDLVNWEIINYAIKRLPDKAFDLPQHGCGVWAPSIRYHDGYFYIFYGDPDRGIYMVRTNDIYGEWEPPVLIKEAKGWIDPCPLWDDDGNAYIVHAFARSRAGIKSILHVCKMSPDGKKILDDGVLIFDGRKTQPTIEGPKFYKMRGYYYIFAPAGGVKNGWQTVLRSKNVYGPYEEKIVMHQGNTDINGPHQGGYIELDNGEGWFVHFQDRDVYGRIVHLQPVKWINDWPLIGVDIDGDGIGEPVYKYRKPEVGRTYPIKVPQTVDEFNSDKLGLQWQWHANYYDDWYSLVEKEGFLRLYCQKKPEVSKNNLWMVPNLLLQKLPAPEFSAYSLIKLNLSNVSDRAGLIVFGCDYSFIGVEKRNDGIYLVKVVCINANEQGSEIVEYQRKINKEKIYFKVRVKNGAVCEFYYSFNGKKYKKVGEDFIAKPGHWIGAKIGLFAVTDSIETGYVDIDYFRILKK
ncbi:MAG: glycosyl hydrolase 43 family protein [Candidatus Marinimicrobia bacterium]|nr:glycosyl hydrolase 43 family protein [Candidatus Neomarinimicrobiota bacterium]